MKRIRLGNTIDIVWEIFLGKDKDKGKYDLTGKKLTIYLVSAFDRIKISDFTTEFNVLRFTFEGKEQKHAGRYQLTFVENEGGDDTRTLDKCDAFELVRGSCMETDDLSEITLASSFDALRIYPIIPQVGPNRNWWVDGVDTGKSSVGLTAYEFAKEQGYEGTEEEYAAECLAVPVLNEESREATEAATKAAEAATIAAKSATDAAESANNASAEASTNASQAAVAAASANEAAEKANEAAGKAEEAIEAFGAHNIGSIDLFEQIIAQKQNHDLTLEDKEAILNGKVITTSVGEAVVPTISINSIEGLGLMLKFHYNERLYSMCVMWNNDRCYINGFFSFSVDSKLYADSELSETSENSVQNKVVTEKLAELSEEINGNDKVMLTATSSGANPNTGKRPFSFNAGNFTARFIDSDGVINITYLPIYLYDADGALISSYTLTKNATTFSVNKDVAFVGMYLSGSNVAKSGEIAVEFKADGVKVSIREEVDGKIDELNGKVSIVAETAEKDVTYVSGSFINMEGRIVPNSSYKYSAPIQISQGSYIKVTALGAKGNVSILSKCDSSGSNIVPLIIADESVEKTYDYLSVEDGYIIICGTSPKVKVYESSLGNFLISYTDNRESYKPSKTYCDYEGQEISVFNKGICVGDSLTQGTMNYKNGGADQYVNIEKYSYPSHLAKLTGIEIDNKGRGGDASFEWYNVMKEEDLSGYDFAIIQLGVNDAIRNMANYGTEWSEESRQGFLNIINKLKNENEGIKIFVATIIPAISYSSAASIAICQRIRDLVAELNDVNVILLDMQIHGHTKDSDAYNCGHLSAYGYWRLAKDYQSIISYYINTHKMEFREVQFIGTDYSYS